MIENADLITANSSAEKIDVAQMIENADSITEELPAEKIDVVLVVLNSDSLEDAVNKLNSTRANLIMIVTDNYGKRIFDFGEKKIPVTTFATLHLFTARYKRLIWLISGGANADDLLKMKKFLMLGGVPESNIINFDIDPQISATWLANLRYIAENGAEFFITGNEYAQADVNLNLIPTVARGGVNLACAGQTLRQSYLTAKYVFEHVEPGTIKFVLIGLMPYSLKYRKATNFLNVTQNLQYALLSEKPSDDEKLIMDLLNEDFKNLLTTATVEQADLNFDAIRTTRRSEPSAKMIAAWEDVTKFFAPDATENNNQIVEDYITLKNYIELCLANGAEPVGVVFPFTPIIRKNYSLKLLTAFSEIIHQLEESHAFTCIDMFKVQLSYDCFCDVTHLNDRGQLYVNSLIALKLWQMKLLPTEGFCEMSYEFFNRLARRAPQEEYNELMNNVFKASVAKIRRKKKIKLGFVMVEAAQWCGDDLYNLFTSDDRFETTIFLSMDFHKDINDLVKEDFWHGIEQLQSHDLNVIPMDTRESTYPEQDVLIYLTPYFNWLPYALRFLNVPVKTLIAHIPYGFDSSLHDKYFYSQPIFCVAWKVFFYSALALNLYKNECLLGVPRGLYAGYPKIDIFFKSDAQFQFDWKMARPDAKKIIWAPHHSMVDEALIKFATFQWNYQFMYEFAKTHLETSWVIKPHPLLLFRAIKYGLFPSVEAFDEYWKKWNKLPNAQVYTGGYYQSIFATSDGMIHDSCSFIAEYQYVDKPMIFLTRDTQEFNEQGKKILSVSYLVDGQDLDTIAATMQRVFIEGDDYRAAERRELFNEHLNYPKANGMLASEFIYHSIADELEEVPE